MSIITELLKDAPSAANLGSKVVNAEDQGIVATLFGIPIGFQLGTALGIENTVARIAFDILTDPITYLTGGIGGLTKMGRAVKMTKNLSSGERASQIATALEISAKAAGNPQAAADILRHAATGNIDEFNRAAKLFNDIPLTEAAKGVLSKKEVKELENLFDVVNKTEGLKAMELSVTKAAQAAAGQRALVQFSVPLFTGIQKTVVSGEPVFKLFSNASDAIKSRLSPEAFAKTTAAGAKAAGTALETTVPLSDVGFWRRTLESGEAVLRKLGPSGEKLADTIKQQRNDSDALAGQWLSSVDTALKGLSKAELDDVVNILDKGTAPLTKAAGDGAILLRSMLDDIFRLGDKTLTGKQLENALQFRDNYFPHHFTFDSLRSGKKRESMITQLVKSGQFQNRALAERHLDEFLARGQERIFGNLETERLFDIDGWVRNPRQALSLYVTRAARRITEVQNFGKKDNIVETLLLQIRKEGGDEKFARRLFERWVGKNAKTTQMSTLAGWLTSFQVASKLGLAQITNAPQGIVNTAFATNVKTAMRAFRASFTKEGRDFALRAGATAPALFNEMADIAKQGFLARVASDVLKYTGFTAAETANRVTAALGGKFRAQWAADVVLGTAKGSKKKAEKVLHELGIDPKALKARGVLTENELLGAGLRMSNLTQFRSDALELPEFFRSEWGKVFVQFKSFAFNHLKFLKKVVLDDVASIKDGDFSVIPAFLAKIGVAVVAGEISTDVRMALTGKDPLEREVNANRLVENFAKIGGIGIMGDFMRSTAFGERGVYSFFAGPTFSDVSKLISGVGREVRKEGLLGAAGEIGTQTIGKLPVVGRPFEKQIRSAARNAPGTISVNAKPPEGIQPFDLLERLKVGPPR